MSDSASSVVLRDGRVVRVEPFTERDDQEAAELVRAQGDPRVDVYIAAARRRASGHAGEPIGSFVARAGEDDRLVGVAVYVGDDLGAGECAGVVDPDYRDVGVGSLLLRRVSEDARATGLATLRVELVDGAEGTAAMLRDCGLASDWDLDYPVAHVNLALGVQRPGWRTP